MDHLRYGGHTTCFSVEAGAGAQVIIDCGTGMTFAAVLQPLSPTHFHVFLTHYHLDHLLGLQSFRPLFSAEHRFTFYGHPPAGMSIEEALSGVFARPWFPVELQDLPSQIEYVELDDSAIHVGALHVASVRLHHPQGSTGYRLTHGSRSAVVATDHESGLAAVDARLVEFARGVDVLIHDAQYTPAEYAQMHEGWGHSTWADAIATAQACGAGHLVLTSHDPFRTDAEIDAIVAEARRSFPSVEAAHEGLIVEL
jgi:ribonuclease BN (tRNA processing enzyme)